MLPVIPQQVNKFIQDQEGLPSTFPFPENIAGKIPKQLRQKIFQWELNNYIWGQVQERRPFENTWDKLLGMARATWKISETDIDEKTRLARQYQSNILDQSDTYDGNCPLSDRIKVADTVIFDAIDRLTNLSHFIQFKEELPVRYELPADMELPHENDVYSPSTAFNKAANSWLKFNASNQDVYRKDWMTARHHYTYGISLVESNFEQKIEMIQRRTGQRPPAPQFAPVPELTKIGITFEPLSIRKVWMNYRIPIYKMEYQPCPFYFEEVPRFAIIANEYDPISNPMGYSNLDTLMYPYQGGEQGQWLFTGEETASLQAAYNMLYPKAEIPFETMLEPCYSVELKWTLYPMLPLDWQSSGPDPSQPPIFLFDDEVWYPNPELPPSDDGQPQYSSQKIDDKKQRPKMQRFIQENFGTSLTNGQQEILRLQKNFFPHDKLPIYGSAHMPSLDDGLYSTAIGTILEGHYRQICKALQQFLLNKDWNNDPPCDIITGSPATYKKDINAPGARNIVNGMNDIMRRPGFDASNTTLEFLNTARGQVQTSSKSTDAILGKAMGSRTSATEASNVFQTAMSGVTTDVNLFTHDIMGGYATRVWDYTSQWVDPDILQAITGTYGFVIKPEHMLIRLGLKWDAGSQFIESITRASNVQYALQSSLGDPTVNRAPLWRQLFTEWRFKQIDSLVNDGGREDNIQISTEQAIQTYMGMLVMVDPEQDHSIGIKVKISFLKDRQSFWNTNPQTVQYGQRLVQQIQQHQQYLQLQMIQMQQMQQQQAIMGDAQILQPLQNETAAPGAPASTAGQQRQQTGQ